MDLDKYRRTSPPPIELPGADTTATAPEAPVLNHSIECIRQKANRYRTYVGQDTAAHVSPAPEAMGTSATALPVPDSQSDIDGEVSPKLIKGNGFKSERSRQTRQKLLVKTPASSRKKEASPLSGVKIVFLDETMREEYIQIAGYLMVRHRVKLTMTAYFCFLHEQALAQQSDETFLSALAQFAKSGAQSTTPQ